MTPELIVDPDFLMFLALPTLAILLAMIPLIFGRFLMTAVSRALGN